MPSTATRDAIVAHIKANEGKLLTAEEIAAAIHMKASSVSQALHKLGTRAMVISRRRDGGKSYEYAAGRRFSLALKSVGKRITKRSRISKVKYDSPTNGSAIPAVAGGVGIVVKIDGQAHTITLATARALFDDLSILFAKM